MRRILNRLSTLFLSALMACTLMTPVSVYADGEAQEVDLSFTISDGSDGAVLKDDDYTTYEVYNSEASITVSSDTAFTSLYLEWYALPEKWTLEEGSSQSEEGKNGFLHEYVKLAKAETEVTLHLPANAKIANIHAYTEGTLPEDVQVWEAGKPDVDFLVFSTHADDEILWLGAAMAKYGGQQGLSTQVVYMCHYWNGSEPVREHEKLDGLWADGIHTYPINMDYEDQYSKTLEEAQAQYDEDQLTGDVTSLIRQYHPLIVLTQDFKGEYGHGAHMLLAKAVAEAVDHSADQSFHSDSASKYGTYDVPKAYFHLYKENQIRLDLHQPLDRFDGRDAVQVASDAYKKHVSQQKWVLYVDDDLNNPESDIINCSLFGLYKTSVGADTSNDMMENLTSYEDQAKQAQASASAEAEEKVEDNAKQSRLSKVLVVILVLLIALILFVVICLIRKKIRRERRRRRREARRRHRQNQR
jgi:LmbE family N-acetylglucosaminyl deacetylase